MRLQLFISCVRETPHPTYFLTTCDPCDTMLCTIYRQLQFSLFLTAPLKLDSDSHGELTQSSSLYFVFFSDRHECSNQAVCTRGSQSTIQSFYHILVTYSVNLFLFRCHNLVYASLCYCEHVTDAGVELLGTLPSLTSLDLSGCNIQDQGIAALGNNPRFRDLTLAECPNITDLGLQVRH